MKSNWTLTLEAVNAGLAVTILSWVGGKSYGQSFIRNSLQATYIAGKQEQ